MFCFRMFFGKKKEKIFSRTEKCYSTASRRQILYTLHTTLRCESRDARHSYQNKKENAGAEQVGGENARMLET